MGASKMKRERFKAMNPVCCYCGGVAESTTIDHWPSRAIFDDRKAPAGYEFPACVNCNQSSAAEETLFAVLCRLGKDRQDKGADPADLKHYQALRELKPDLFASLVPTPEMIASYLERMGLPPDPELTPDQFPAVSLAHPEIEVGVKACATKLFLSLYYFHVGRPLPPEGFILFKWYTNADNPDMLGLEHIAPLLHYEVTPQWQRIDISDQFSYQYSADPDQGIALFVTQFNNALGMVGAAFPDIARSAKEWTADKMLRPLVHLAGGAR